MKKFIFLLLFVTVLTCHSQISEVSITTQNYDSLKIVVVELKQDVDSLNNKFLSDNFITLEALMNSQTFYDTAFDKIYDSYSTFLTRIAIVVAIVGIIFSWNWWQGQRYNKKLAADLKNANKKILELELKSKERILDIEGKFKKEIEAERKKNQVEFNTSHRIGLELFYSSADDACKVGEWKKHFMNLAGFYLTLGGISEFGKPEFKFLEDTGKFIDKYKATDVDILYSQMPSRFFSHFLQFIKYSEEMSEMHPEKTIIKAIFNEAKRRYNQLLEIFTYDKIKERIGKAKSPDSFENKMSILELAELYRSKD